MANKTTARLRATLGYAGLALFAMRFLLSPAFGQQPSPSPIPPPAQPAPESPNAPTAPVPSTAEPARSSPSSHMMRTWRRLTYACDGDTKVVVNLHGTMAKVVFKGHTYNLKQAEGSDGHKYTDGSVTWMEKDEVGSLEQVLKAGGEGRSLTAGCHLQTAGTTPPNPSQSGKTPSQK
jgi:membrane-bound inhibitor of C-type lysozyme